MTRRLEWNLSGFVVLRSISRACHNLFGGFWNKVLIICGVWLGHSLLCLWRIREKISLISWTQLAWLWCGSFMALASSFMVEWPAVYIVWAEHCSALVFISSSQGWFRRWPSVFVRGRNILQSHVVFNLIFTASRCLNFASHRGGCVERSYPRSAALIHSVVVDRCESNTQPSNWEADTLPLSCRRPTCS